MPELSTLKPLSDILEITINELLSGEKVIKGKFILIIYNKYVKVNILIRREVDVYLFLQYIN